MYRIFTKHGNGNDYSINRFSLAFKDRKLEKQFSRSYFESNLHISRACHIIAIFYFSVVGLWEAVVVDPGSLSLWLWVIGVISIIFVSGLAFSYLSLPHYARYWQQIFAFYVFATGSGFVLVSVFAGEYLPVYNFVGIIFCLFFCYAFIRLTFLWASVAGNAIVLLYAASVALFTDIASKQQAIGVFYMVGHRLSGNDGLLCLGDNVAPRFCPQCVVEKGREYRQ